MGKPTKAEGAVVSIYSKAKFKISTSEDQKVSTVWLCIIGKT